MSNRCLPTQNMDHHNQHPASSPSLAKKPSCCSHRAACLSLSKKPRPRRSYGGTTYIPHTFPKKEFDEDQQLLSPSSIVLEPLAQYIEDDFNDDLAGLELENIDETRATNGYLDENEAGLIMNDATRLWTGNEKEHEFLALEIADLEHSFIQSNQEKDNTMFVVPREEWLEDIRIHNSNILLPGKSQGGSLDIRQFADVLAKKNKL